MCTRRDINDRYICTRPQYMCTYNVPVFPNGNIQRKQIHCTYAVHMYPSMGTCRVHMPKVMGTCGDACTQRVPMTAYMPGTLVSPRAQYLVGTRVPNMYYTVFRYTTGTSTSGTRWVHARHTLGTCQVHVPGTCRVHVGYTSGTRTKICRAYCRPYGKVTR